MKNLIIIILSSIILGRIVSFLAIVAINRGVLEQDYIEINNDKIGIDTPVDRQ